MVSISGQAILDAFKAFREQPQATLASEAERARQIFQAEIPFAPAIQKKTTIPTGPGGSSLVALAPETIRRQQSLSEQFGIPTFNLTGNISTVPITKRLSDINVGTGAFTGETQQSFRTNLQNIIDNIFQTGGTIGSTLIPGPAPAGPISKGGTGGAVQGPSNGLSNSFNDGLSQASEFIAQNPSVLIIGLGLIAVMVLK